MITWPYFFLRSFMPFIFLFMFLVYSFTGVGVRSGSLDLLELGKRSVVWELDDELRRLWYFFGYILLFHACHLFPHIILHSACLWGLGGSQLAEGCEMANLFREEISRLEQFGIMVNRHSRHIYMYYTGMGQPWYGTLSLPALLA